MLPIVAALSAAAAHAADWSDAYIGYTYGTKNLLCGPGYQVSSPSIQFEAHF